MLRHLILGSLLVSAGSAFSQNLPFETVRDRTPTLDQKTRNVDILADRVITVSGETIKKGAICVRDGKIVYVGLAMAMPRFATPAEHTLTAPVAMPGLVDTHIHRGIGTTNEFSDAITIESRIRDSVEPTDITWWQALASGETSGLALHGSANPIGGESVVIKFKYNALPNEAFISDAPRMVKFALGENVMGNGTRYPRTRMGTEAVYRRAFNSAREYMKEWENYEKGGRKGLQPRHDVRLEAISDILRRKIWVQCHSYRADEILMMAKLSKEYGFKIGAMQHALEAYKVAPELAKLDVPVSMFSDNWSFKIEGYDSISSGPAICYKSGVLTSVNTDGVSGTTTLIYDAAKLIREGGLTENQAFRTVTLNSAMQLGISNRVGSLEVGKDADIALYSGHPFAVGSKVLTTMIEGKVLFQRKDAFQIDGKHVPALDLPVPAVRDWSVPKGSTSVAIRGAEIYLGNGKRMRNATMLLKNGRIAGMGAGIAIPSGYSVMDAKGLSLYPPMIDAGTAIGLSEISSVPDTVDVSENGDFQPDIKAQTAIQAASAHIGVAACHGIMLALSRPSGGIISGQATILQMFGDNNDELTRVPTFAMTVSIPGAAPSRPFKETHGCRCFGTTLDELLNGPIHDHSKDGEVKIPADFPSEGWEPEEDRDHDHQSEAMAQEPSDKPKEPEFTGRLKTLDEYMTTAKEYLAKKDKDPNGTIVDLRLEAMRGMIEGKMPVILRVRTSGSILNAIAFAKKHKLKGILSGAAEAWKVADKIKDSGYPVIITASGESTLSANQPLNDFDPYDSPYINPWALNRAGVLWCFQSDDNAMSFNLPMRAGFHTAYGLSQDDAIDALTRDAAKILGLDGEVGMLKIGAKADLIVTNGHPVESTTTVVGAFLGGTPVPMVSKHTMLRDRYMARIGK